jgi:hypothetical protein
MLRAENVRCIGVMLKLAVVFLPLSLAVMAGAWLLPAIGSATASATRLEPGRTTAPELRARGGLPPFTVYRAPDGDELWYFGERVNIATFEAYSVERGASRAPALLADVVAIEFDGQTRVLKNIYLKAKDEIPSPP